MKIEYKSRVITQNIDINKLRPDKSYDYLIKNRNASGHGKNLRMYAKKK